jgi:3-dehydroquinate synthase
MHTIGVRLGARAYDVRVGTGSLGELGSLLGPAGLGDASAFALVADAAVGRAIDDVATALAPAGVAVHRIVLDVTEASNSAAGLAALYDRFVDVSLDRRGVVVALGGGVTGDLAGYAAATYLRGVRWIGLPTTLLAAVDSAIGGKTGINHARGKNLIGAIHQPSLVVVDPATFATLPARERFSGFGEMLKYGLALDARLWDELLATDPMAVTDAQIARCIERKAEIVAADEHDVAGIRETLNFGHTIAHALESATDYTYYRHGEAVIAGMRAAVRISTRRGHLSAAVAGRVDDDLRRYAIPAMPRVDPAAIVAAVGRDKKTSHGKTRFVLLRDIGRPVSDAGVTPADITDALALLEAACASPS